MTNKSLEGSLLAHDSRSSRAVAASTVPHTTWRQRLRTRWTPEGRMLRWYIALQDGPLIGDSERAVARVLDSIAQLDVNRLEGWHITLGNLGFASDFSTDSLGKEIRRVETALRSQRPFRLRIGAIGAVPGAVVRWVGPISHIERLQSALATPHGAQSSAGWHHQLARQPHVKLAHVRQEVDLTEVIAALPKVRNVDVRVTQVTLAEVRLGGRHSQWRARRQLALGDGQ